MPGTNGRARVRSINMSIVSYSPDHNSSDLQKMACSFYRVARDNKFSVVIIQSVKSVKK